MLSDVQEAALIFGARKDSSLSRAQAVDTLSALGFPLRDSDAEELLPKDVNAEELVDIASKLRMNRLKREDLAQLVHDLNPNTSGTISRGTLVYILKTNSKASDEELEEFLDALGAQGNNGMIQVESLINSLMSVLD